MVTLIVLSFGASSLAAVDCRPAVEAAERRDCFPWTENVTADACLARGCLWCDDDVDGDYNATLLPPPCFYDDDVCPSVIDESLRIECPSNAFNRTDCLRSGCIWCSNTTSTGNFQFQNDVRYETTRSLGPRLKSTISGSSNT